MKWLTMIRLKIKNESEYGTISPISLFLYKQEFNQDLLVDGLTVIYEGNTALLLKIVWVMLKTVNNSLESYNQWINELNAEDIEIDETLVVTELLSRLLISVDDDKEVKTKENNKEKDLGLGILKTITDLRMDLNLVNLMSIDTFIKFQELHISESGSTKATPKQASAFFL